MPKELLLNFIVKVEELLKIFESKNSLNDAQFIRGLEQLATFYYSEKFVDYRGEIFESLTNYDISIPPDPRMAYAKEHYFFIDKKMEQLINLSTFLNMKKRSEVIPQNITDELPYTLRVLANGGRIVRNYLYDIW